MIARKPKRSYAELEREVKGLKRALSEAHEQQTATAEILRIISGSPMDTQPVFDAIAQSALRLFHGHHSAVILVNGDQMERPAYTGGAKQKKAQDFYPMPLDRSTLAGRAIVDRKLVHVRDIRTEADLPERGRAFAEKVGFRAAMIAPMMRENSVIGAVAVSRASPGGFTDNEIALLKTFTDQAVIAVENVRLFKELQARNADLTEALEQQTATNEILNVISHSTLDVAPVFQSVVEKAVELCGADNASILQREGDLYRYVANAGNFADQDTFMSFWGTITLRPGRGSLTGRVALERRSVQIEDVDTDPEYEREYAAHKVSGSKAHLGVPLLKGGEPVGLIIARRFAPQLFTGKQIKILETFAAQAVIAVENVRLFKELQATNTDLTEALEQQTATSEILGVISSSPTDLQPVFDTIVRNATRLCAASRGALRLYDGHAFTEMVAEQGAPTAYSEWRRRHGRLRPDPLSAAGQVVAEKRVIHIADLAQTPAYINLDPLTVASVELGGTRTILVVPMLKEGTLIGAIVIHRQEVQPFTDKQIALLKTFADQAVIAIENVRLFKELQARNAEITEALEQQTATAEILRIISSSPTDTQPVFDAIVKSGVRLFGGQDVSLRLVKGDQTELVATTEPAFDAVHLPTPLNDDRRPSARTILRREVVQIPDLLAEEWVSERTKERAERRGNRALLYAPMLREKNAIGAISVSRVTAGPFTDKEVALLKTFADQAVIAIENVRLFKELQARNAELSESLEQQTATAEILRVISSSPTDIQPVLEAVAHNAARLCGANDVVIRLLDGDVHRAVAHYGPIPIVGPLPVRGSIAGRAILDRKTVHIEDLLKPNVRAEFREADATAGGYRTFLAAPLVREDTAVGAIVMRRGEVAPFTDKQIELLETFAAQAVIAIENVRLFKELQAKNADLTEALEQQTATSEILRVISSSPTDLQPVFDAVLESATRLCGAHMGTLGLYDGTNYENVAQRGGTTAYVKYLFRGPYRPESATVIGRMIAERQAVHVPNLIESPQYLDRVPAIVATVEFGGARAVLAVPMLKEGRMVGGIFVYRPDARPFSQKQIDLVSTFANQAVIAIENVRLFKEINEALSQQTATANVLKLISRTTFELQPVLDTLVQSAAELCEAQHAIFFRVDPDGLRPEAWHNVGDEYVAYRKANPVPMSTHFVTGRVALTRELVHVHDILADADFKSTVGPKLGGMRSVLGVPVLREGELLGVMGIYRREVRPFSEKQIELVKTFADQAVIAIENVRLFKELQARNADLTEALEQQTATSEILRVISSSPTDTQPVFDTIVKSGVRLFRGLNVAVLLVKGDQVDLAASTLAAAEVSGLYPFPLSENGMVSCRAILRRELVQVPDVFAQDWISGRMKQLAKSRGFNAVIAAPLLRENKAIGAVAVTRATAGPFSDKEVALLRTFADQAVIAIENVRLFHETKEALDQQTATAEILKVISSSPTDVQPVFDAIVQSGVRLFEGAAVAVALPDGESVRAAAIAEGDPERAAIWKSRFPFPLTREYMHGAAILDCKVVDVPDAQKPEGDLEAGIKNFLACGYRAITIMPMVRGSGAIGAISVLRLKAGALSSKQMALLQTFADQAVIAIENVRLFNETKEALEQQTVISEILRVISSSPTDVQPVFEAIVNSGAHLFSGIYEVSLRLVKGDLVETVASTLPIHDTGGANPAQLDDESAPAPRALRRREVVQIPDILAAEEWVGARAKQRAGQRGWRALLAAPMLRENNAIGVIAVTRVTPGPFTDKQIALVKTFADQAVIAIENVRLFKELQARNAEVTEALEQQTVTADILKVISSSPTDTQPVFDAIVRSGVHLFGGMNMSLRLVKGEHTEPVASTIPLRDADKYPVALSDDGSPSAQAIRRREVVQVPDLFAEEWVSEPAKQRAKRRGFRAIVSAPMLRENTAIGVINVLRAAPGPFTDKHIALLKTFTDQAVIAIENVRLFNETKEALEQQTVISEILRVISSSPTDVQPVFDAIVKSGVRLFEGAAVAVALPDGNQVRAAAIAEGDPERAAMWKSRFPFPLTREYMHGAAILDCKAVDIPDARQAGGDWEAGVKNFLASGYRAITIMPMVRGKGAIGAISVLRLKAGALSSKQMALLQTFADQAVIAIENVRLFNETKEALEQQTATADILRVISSSPTDTQPVFDAIVKSGLHLFGGVHASLRLVKGDHTEVAASTSPLGVGDDSLAPLNEERFPTSRAIQRREAVQVPDLFAEDWVSERLKRRADQMGFRAILSAPMLRENTAIGAIAVSRATPGLFTEKQVALLKTFADQAVIAIENVRLFKELQARNAEITESLEQQTATSDILRVISGSLTDTQPVFDAIVNSGARLFGGSDVSLRLVNGDRVELVASTLSSDAGNVFSFPHDGRSAVSRSIQQRALVHYPDITREDWVDEDVKRVAERRSIRAVVSAPMLRENTAIGAILVSRATPGLYTEKHIALIRTFADQAVIAIENVRLFREINEALERQTATSEVLKVISRSTFDLDPVLESLAENARKLCNADSARISRPNKDGNYVVVIESALEPRPEHLARMRSHPLRPDRGSAVGRAVLDRRPVHIPDVLADPEYTRLDIAESGGYRTVLAVPMLRGGEPIGVIVLTRTKEVRPFTDKQVEVVTTFADQAVIAIENVRLFNEIQDKSQQLEIANKHKSEFLAHMSHELRTPLNAINGFSEMLLARMFGDLNEKQEEFLRDINSSGEHLLSLINDVLDLSKIEAGRMELHLTAFDPGATLDNTVMLVKERASRRGITVSLEADERLDRWVGDERKIRQVMLNLLSNAVKFTPEGGRIDVRAKRDGSEMVVAVSDTGIGIKPDDQARIFEEFQQAGTDYTKKAEGTGLGLALSRKFVELHGGTLKVESAEGKGSTFTFTLPEMQEATV